MSEAVNKEKSPPEPGEWVGDRYTGCGCDTRGHELWCKWKGVHESEHEFDAVANGLMPGVLWNKLSVEQKKVAIELGKRYHPLDTELEESQGPWAKHRFYFYFESYIGYDLKIALCECKQNVNNKQEKDCEYEKARQSRE